MAEQELHGSGGYVIADISDELAKKADLGVGKKFLAPIGKLDETWMKRHFCKECNEEFPNPPKVKIEESENEQVADGLILTERGQYKCHKCNSIIGEYRVFEKTGDPGMARPEGAGP